MISTTLTLLLAVGLGLTLSVLALASAWNARLRAELAEQRARINRLSERVDRLESPPINLPEEPLRSRPEPIVEPTSREPQPPQGEVPGPITEPTLIAVPNLAANGEPDRADAASSELARRFRAIWDLRDRGADAEAIARASGQPVGQVELILGLRRSLTLVGPAANETDSDGEAAES